MPRPWRIRYAGAKYHLTTRGNGRQAVFLEDADRERFLEQLQDALEKDGVILYAYVLMPNHYHLLVETPLGNVHRFMQRLNTAYGMYFRYKHQRVGHCFQGRYSARLVKGDDYLTRLTRYIHLNPVKVRGWTERSAPEKKACLEQYRWSSYREYAGLEVQKDWIDYRWLKLMGGLTTRGNQRGYRKYIDQMMGATDEVLQEARDRHLYAIGDKKFAERTDEDLIAASYSKADTGDIRWPEKKRPPLDEVVNAVVKLMGCTVQDLKRHGLGLGEKKRIAIELLCQLSGVSQRALLPYCGYSQESAVGKQRKAFRKQLAEDTSLVGKFNHLRKQAAKILEI